MKRGFTTAELLIAVAIIVTALLLILATFTSVLRSSEKSENLATGSILAEAVVNQQIETLLYDPASRTAFFNSPGLPPSPILGTVNLEGTVFTFEITHATVNRNGGGTIGDGLAENRLKKIDAVVWWMVDDPDEQRQGSGYLRTEFSRVLNENARIE